MTLCRHCTQPLGDGCTCSPCRWCKRPKHVCHEPVDERWPAAAREAYALHNLTTAAKCERGQAEDLRLTRGSTRPGWNLDRAIWSPLWKGPAPTGMGETYYRELERAKSQKRPIGASR